MAPAPFRSTASPVRARAAGGDAPQEGQRDAALDDVAGQQPEEAVVPGRLLADQIGERSPSSFAPASGRRSKWMEAASTWSGVGSVIQRRK